MMQHVEMEIGTPTQPMRLKVDGVDLLQFGVRELQLNLGPPTSSKACAGVPELIITYAAKRVSVTMAECDVKEWLYCDRCGRNRPLPEERTK